jgi:hypothetical protein
LKSFSPALADPIGLRRVMHLKEINPEGIESGAADRDATPLELEFLWDDD